MGVGGQGSCWLYPKVEFIQKSTIVGILKALTTSSSRFIRDGEGDYSAPTRDNASMIGRADMTEEWNRGTS